MSLVFLGLLLSVGPAAADSRDEWAGFRPLATVPSCKAKYVRVLNTLAAVMAESEGTASVRRPSQGVDGGAVEHRGVLEFAASDASHGNWTYEGLFRTNAASLNVFRESGIGPLRPLPYLGLEDLLRLAASDGSLEVDSNLLPHLDGPSAGMALMRALMASIIDFNKLDASKSAAMRVILDAFAKCPRLAGRLVLDSLVLSTRMSMTMDQLKVGLAAESGHALKKLVMSLDIGSTIVKKILKFHRTTVSPPEHRPEQLARHDDEAPSPPVASATNPPPPTAAFANLTSPAYVPCSLLEVRMLPHSDPSMPARLARVLRLDANGVRALKRSVKHHLCDVLVKLEPDVARAASICAGVRVPLDLLPPACLSEDRVAAQAGRPAPTSLPAMHLWSEIWNGGGDYVTGNGDMRRLVATGMEPGVRPKAAITQEVLEAQRPKEAMFFTKQSDGVDYISNLSEDEMLSNVALAQILNEFVVDEKWRVARRVQRLARLADAMGRQHGLETTVQSYVSRLMQAGIIPNVPASAASVEGERRSRFLVDIPLDQGCDSDTAAGLQHMQDAATFSWGMENEGLQDLQSDAVRAAFSGQESRILSTGARLKTRAQFESQVNAVHYFVQDLIATGHEIQVVAMQQAANFLGIQFVRNGGAADRSGPDAESRRRNQFLDAVLRGGVTDVALPLLLESFLSEAEGTPVPGMHGHLAFRVRGSLVNGTVIFHAGTSDRGKHEGAIFHPWRLGQQAAWAGWVYSGEATAPEAAANMLGLAVSYAGVANFFTEQRGIQGIGGSGYGALHVCYTPLMVSYLAMEHAVGHTFASRPDLLPRWLDEAPAAAPVQPDQGASVDSEQDRGKRLTSQLFQPPFRALAIGASAELLQRIQELAFVLSPQILRTLRWELDAAAIDPAVRTALLDEAGHVLAQEWSGALVHGFGRARDLVALHSYTTNDPASLCSRIEAIGLSWPWAPGEAPLASLDASLVKLCRAYAASCNAHSCCLASMCSAVEAATRVPQHRESTIATPTALSSTVPMAVPQEVQASSSSPFTMALVDALLSTRSARSTALTKRARAATAELLDVFSHAIDKSDVSSGDAGATRGELMNPDLPPPSASTTDSLPTGRSDLAASPVSNLPALLAGAIPGGVVGDAEELAGRPVTRVESGPLTAAAAAAAAVGRDIDAEEAALEQVIPDADAGLLLTAEQRSLLHKLAQHASSGANGQAPIDGPAGVGLAGAAPSRDRRSWAVLQGLSCGLDRSTGHSTFLSPPTERCPLAPWTLAAPLPPHYIDGDSMARMRSPPLRSLSDRAPLPFAWVDDASRHRVWRYLLNVGYKTQRGVVSWSALLRMVPFPDSSAVPADGPDSALRGKTFGQLMHDFPVQWPLTTQAALLREMLGFNHTTMERCTTMSTLDLFEDKMLGAVGVDAASLPLDLAATASVVGESLPTPSVALPVTEVAHATEASSPSSASAADASASPSMRAPDDGLGVRGRHSGALQPLPLLDTAAAPAPRRRWSMWSRRKLLNIPLPGFEGQPPLELPLARQAPCRSLPGAAADGEGAAACASSDDLPLPASRSELASLASVSGTLPATASLPSSRVQTPPFGGLIPAAVVSAMAAHSGSFCPVRRDVTTVVKGVQCKLELDVLSKANGLAWSPFAVVQGAPGALPSARRVVRDPWRSELQSWLTRATGWVTSLKLPSAPSLAGMAASVISMCVRLRRRMHLLLDALGRDVHDPLQLVPAIWHTWTPSQLRSALQSAHDIRSRSLSTLFEDLLLARPRTAPVALPLLIKGYNGTATAAHGRRADPHPLRSQFASGWNLPGALAGVHTVVSPLPYKEVTASALPVVASLRRLVDGWAAAARRSVEALGGGTASRFPALAHLCGEAARDLIGEAMIDTAALFLRVIERRVPGCFAETPHSCDAPDFKGAGVAIIELDLLSLALHGWSESALSMAREQAAEGRSTIAQQLEELVAGVRALHGPSELPSVLPSIFNVGPARKPAVCTSLLMREHFLHAVLAYIGAPASAAAPA